MGSLVKPALKTAGRIAAEAVLGEGIVHYGKQLIFEQQSDLEELERLAQDNSRRVRRIEEGIVSIKAELHRLQGKNLANAATFLKSALVEGRDPELARRDMTRAREFFYTASSDAEMPLAKAICFRKAATCSLGLGDHTVASFECNLAEGYLLPEVLLALKLEARLIAQSNVEHVKADIGAFTHPFAHLGKGNKRQHFTDLLSPDYTDPTPFFARNPYHSSLELVRNLANWGEVDTLLKNREEYLTTQRGHRGWLGVTVDVVHTGRRPPSISDLIKEKKALSSVREDLREGESSEGMKTKAAGPDPTLT